MTMRAETIAALRTDLETELHTIERVAAMARDEATNAETKAEGKYDTRATEASYLARGQAERIAALRHLHAWYNHLDPDRILEEPRVCLGALVCIESSTEEWVFIAPSGGAQTSVNGTTIRVISRSSPLGAAMDDLEPGDGLEVDTPRGLIEYEILSVL